MDGDFINDPDEVLNASSPLDSLSWPNFTDGDLAPLGSPCGLVNAADYLIAQRIALGELVDTPLRYRMVIFTGQVRLMASSILQTSSCCCTWSSNNYSLQVARRPWLTAFW